MKILIIEDEHDLLEVLKTFLGRAGYRCEVATTFVEGYRKLVNYDYDCVLIDLNLPGGDGLRLLEVVQRTDYPTGVIIMSARDGVDDRIRGLDLGADDYLVKPFNLSELNARIKAVLRRKAHTPARALEFGELRIVPEERLATVNGEPLALTRKEFEILYYLVRNKNRVVTKDSIAEHLWGDYMDEAESYDFIYAHVKNLRRKLATHGCADYVKTVYGIGYKFSVT